MKNCRVYLLLVLLLCSIFVNAQRKKVMLSLELMRDTVGYSIDPYLILYKNKKVFTYCPCFAYHFTNGKWKQVGDSTYYISVTEKSKEYYYKTEVKDSAAAHGFITLKFITPKGKPIRNIIVKETNDTIEYKGDENGIVRFNDTAISHRLLIKVKKYRNEFLRTFRHRFTDGKSYTIVLPKPVNKHTWYYNLKKEGDLWVMYDKDFKERIAYFTHPRPDPYEKMKE